MVWEHSANRRILLSDGWKAAAVMQSVEHSPLLSAKCIYHFPDIFYALEKER